MRKLFLLLLLLPLAVAAQKLNECHRAVVRLTTFAPQGDTLQQTQAYFCSDKGEIIAPYTALRGAAKAELTDWQGQRATVLRIVAASENFDLVRATTNISTKKLTYLLPTVAAATPQTALWQTAFSTAKKADALTTQVTRVDSFAHYPYYTISAPNEAQYVGCPIVNAEGRVVAVAQKNVTKDATTLCAMGAAATDSLRLSPLAALSSELNAILLPKQLPTESEATAYTYVYMLLRAQRDSTLALTAAHDFMAQYPHNHDVLSDLANFYAARQDYAQADAYLQKAREATTEHPDKVYMLANSLMLTKALTEPASVYPQWTLATALESVQQAISIAPLPQYVFAEATTLQALGRRREAYEKFVAVNQTEAASFASYYRAAQLLSQLNGDSLQIVTLLDSALVRTPKPYTQEAAPAIILRAGYLSALGQARKAVADYNAYEQLFNTQQLTATFYALRSDAEQQARMYQQALDDLETAIQRARSTEERTDFLLQKGYLCLRVRLFAEAHRVAQTLLQAQPSLPEAYELQGITYGEQKQKQKAAAAFAKAQQLGSKLAADLQKKYR